MENNFCKVINSPIGNLGIIFSADALLGIQFLADEKIFPVSVAASPVLNSIQESFCRNIIVQLRQYFANPHFKFTLPLKITGTTLQQLIWQKLTEIPTGETITYGALAKLCGTSARLVGNTCRRNPVPLVIPCHRVVASDGSLGGFAGARGGELLAIKKWLLSHEAITANI